MLGDILFLHSLGREVGFYFVIKEISGFLISDGVCDIIPDLSSDVRKASL